MDYKVSQELIHLIVIHYSLMKTDWSLFNYNHFTAIDSMLTYSNKKDLKIFAKQQMFDQELMVDTEDLSDYPKVGVT